MRVRRTALSAPIGMATVALFLASSMALMAQHDKDKPSRPAPTHQSSPRSSAPSHRSESAPQTHQTPQTHQGGGSTPHATPSTPQASPSPRSGSTTYGGGNRNQGGGSQTAAPGNGNNRQGSGTVYSPNNSGNRNPAGNTASPSGNSRQGSGTVYNNGGNRNPGGNTAAPNNGNSRPGGTFNTNGNNRPGGAPNGGGGFNSGSYRSGGNNSGRNPYPAKAAIYHAPNGGQVQTRSDGSIREVRTSNGAIIHHAPDGGRRIEMQRPGGRVIVANTRGSGYIQRPLVVNNRTYVQRTYVINHVSYARVYRPWVYGGVTFHVYSPLRFWSPGFYAYAYNPWARPVYYGWGWSGRPWYGYYGGWFTPYPYYASPSLWLTDYLIARTLEDAYQARADAAAAAAAQNNYAATPLTPEVKQAVADEVRRQLDQERAEQQSMNSMQSSGVPPIFSGNGPHVFVVANAMDVDAGGQMCPVSEGDVLQLNSPPPSNSTYAQVVVLASKGNDCRKGTTVQVALDDLQEMQNQMRATIDQGLGDLQSKQGQGG
ncbi:MAG TPA: hypothetical protein VGH38_23200, partial [Bryobacteraceae bacterium]